MRTIFRVCLVATVVAAVGLTPVSIAEAQKSGVLGQVSITPFEKKQNKRIRRAKRRAEAAHDSIQNLNRWNIDQDVADGEQQKSLDGLEATVNGILDGAGQLVNGVLALQSALEKDVAPALVAIDDALNDPVTGLVGLNLARPQFGVYALNGTHLGSTGASGGLGPDDDNATPGADLSGGGGPDLDGLYVVDFDNDVSSRVYTVNVLPYVPVTAGGAGTTPSGAAINCAASAGIDSLCDLVLAASGGDPQNVLIQIGSGSAGGAVNGFSVTALSG